MSNSESRVLRPQACDFGPLRLFEPQSPSDNHISSYHLHHVLHGYYHRTSSSTTTNEMKWIFIHSWQLFHSLSLPILLHSVWRMLHSLSHFSCWRLKMSFHSLLVGVSFNVSFRLTPISISTSFPHGNYLMLYLILPWWLFHAILHSFWQLFQLNFHFFMVATSLILGFCFIPLW